MEESKLKHASAILARSISLLIDEGEGVLVMPDEEQSNAFGSGGELIAVGKLNNEIIIIPFNEFTDNPSEFEEGQFIKINSAEE